MSTLKVTNIQSNGAGFNDVVSFQNSGGTENGTLCRAWVNFNGTGTVAIRASGNVSSITDNGTGDYTVNFTTAMADTNFCVTGLPGGNADPNTIGMSWTVAVNNSDFTKTTTSVRVRSVRNTNNDTRDAYGCNVAIFR